MAVTQAQIAELAGVSRGTVDRALKNRGRVDPEVAERIRQIANELGYQPNRAGSVLVRSKRPVRLGVIVQSAAMPYMVQLLDEFEAARPALAQQGAELLVRTIPHIDLELQLRLIDELVQEGIDGLALTPVEDMRIRERIDQLSETLPVVTLNTDIPHSRRLCYIGQNGFQAGRACASLMNILTGGRGKVLMITSFLSLNAHQSRIDGFQTEIEAISPTIELLPLRCCSDQRDIAYQIVCETLEAYPDLAGVYISANGFDGIADALREYDRVGKTRFICYDSTPVNIQNLHAGIIDFLIDQNPHAQAVRPLEVLLDYILDGKRPDEEYMFTHIDIRNRYNV